MKLILLFCLISFAGFSQERDSVTWCLRDLNLWVGSDSIEGKRIISGFYLLKKSETTFDLDLTILDDWNLMDSIKTTVTMDLNTLIYNSNLTEFLPNERFPAVYLKAESGLEIYLAKYGSSFIPNECEFLGYAKIILPKNETHYVDKLPVMYEK